MASSGFDVVRLPLAWSLLEPRRRPSAHGGGLSIVASASHQDQPVVVGWPNLLMAPPAAHGACLSHSSRDRAAGRSTMHLVAGQGWQIRVAPAST
jgi:hypothetical protein